MSLLRLDRVALSCDGCDVRVFDSACVCVLRLRRVMAGLIGLVGRGTIVQVFLATLISFFFFASALKEMPFQSSRMNKIKIFSEAQLFIILFTAALLQTDARGLASQPLGDRDDIGRLQAAVTLASLPLVIYLVGT